jgi:hypothetical protein
MNEDDRLLLETELIKTIKELNGIVNTIREDYEAELNPNMVKLFIALTTSALMGLHTLIKLNKDGGIGSGSGNN